MNSPSDNSLCLLMYSGAALCLGGLLATLGRAGRVRLVKHKMAFGLLNATGMALVLGGFIPLNFRRERELAAFRQAAKLRQAAEISDDAN